MLLTLVINWANIQAPTIAKQWTFVLVLVYIKMVIPFTLQKVQINVQKEIKWKWSKSEQREILEACTNALTSTEIAPPVEPEVQLTNLQSSESKCEWFCIMWYKLLLVICHYFKMMLSMYLVLLVSLCKSYSACMVSLLHTCHH